ncbi:MAG TPA: hypothetical protein VFF98_17370 [Novosphingobium sp.]|nr:hypothetical protein [Novosphingobium sp.]
MTAKPPACKARPPFTPLRAAMALAALLPAACAAPPASHPPAPVPAPLPAPPLAPAPQPADWRAAPLSPGRWHWAMEQGRSTARFVAADGRSRFVLACLPGEGAGTITWLYAAPASGHALATPGPQAMFTTFPDGPHPVLSQWQAGGLVGGLGARQALLDALAFTQGRFVVEIEGMAPLVLPAATEISRVVEDCR